MTELWSNYARRALGVGSYVLLFAAFPLLVWFFIFGAIALFAGSIIVAIGTAAIGPTASVRSERVANAVRKAISAALLGLIAYYQFSHLAPGSTGDPGWHAALPLLVAYAIFLAFTIIAVLIYGAIFYVFASLFEKSVIFQWIVLAVVVFSVFASATAYRSEACDPEWGLAGLVCD